MNKQEVIISNQEVIIKSINDIKEKLNNHEKKIDILSERDVVEVKSTINNKRKGTKDGFSVSMRDRRYAAYLQQLNIIYLIFNWQDEVNSVAQDVFNEHEQFTDEQLKEFLYQKIIKKDDAKELLSALDLKNISFDKLWNEKLHTTVILYIIY